MAMAEVLRNFNRTGIVPVENIQKANDLFRSLTQQEVQLNSYNNANEAAGNQFDMHKKAVLLEVLEHDPLTNAVVLQYNIEQFTDGELIKIQNAMWKVAEDITDANAAERKKFEENTDIIDQELKKREKKVA